MGCGTRLCSDFFEVCGQLFRLEVYPGGFTADASKYVSVFLTTPGSVNPSHIMYELAILDQVMLSHVYFGSWIRAVFLRNLGWSLFCVERAKCLDAAEPRLDWEIFVKFFLLHRF